MAAGKVTGRTLRKLIKQPLPIKKEIPKMPKSKVEQKSTEGVGKGYGKKPLKSPKVGGPGRRELPVRA